MSLILLLVINFIFRLILLVNHWKLVGRANIADIIDSLYVIGFKFDLHISLIILLLPFLLSSVPFLKNTNQRTYLIIASWFISILGLVNIAISSSDLGFFKFYNERITKSIFSWTGEPDVMFKIMANDINYLEYFLFFLLVSAIFLYLQFRILKRVLLLRENSYPLRQRLLVFLVTGIFFFFGIRSSFNFNASPLTLDHAYHSENLFLNQLSLNPVYYMAHSYTKVDIDYFNNSDVFLGKALQYLEREPATGGNPFLLENKHADSLRPNIILIFMESMSHAMVSRYHEELQTTPFLDQLATEGIVFDNFYSAGVHTHNAITSTFYGLPAVMDNKLMGELATAGELFYGMPWILKEKGYTNSFYVTGSKKFDNMNDFLMLNGFDQVIGERDYPKDSIYNAWGVTDQTMFNRVITDCNGHYEAGRSFFSAILTISAHEGYIVPRSYRKGLVNKKMPQSLYEFSDLMLEGFFTAARKSPWFKETVFVLVGDHGQNFHTRYDLNLNYHRVPLIIYGPGFFEYKCYEQPGLQMDIYPTLFGLLDFSYSNNGLGVDLFRHQRPYAYFSADTKVGITDDQYYLIYRNPDNVSLFFLKGEPLKDIYHDHEDKAKEMLNYGFSMIQSAKFLIDNERMGNGLGASATRQSK
ncbi:MAG: sulfatase-like hydrolase/transferase [bacterium]